MCEMEMEMGKKKLKNAKKPPAQKSTKKTTYDRTCGRYGLSPMCCLSLPLKTTLGTDVGRDYLQPVSEALALLDRRRPRQPVRLYNVAHLLLERCRIINRKPLAAAPRPAHIVDRRRPVDWQARLKGCTARCKARWTGRLY